MGFVSGFTGGVTITLSLAYLSILTHQRNRQEQCRILRAQSMDLRSLVDTIPQPLPPSRAEIAAAQRVASIEGAKDRWNEEVENMARWLQNTDWDEARRSLEERAAALWVAIFGESAEAAQRAGEKLQPIAADAKASAKEVGGNIAAAAKASAKEASGNITSAAKVTAQQASGNIAAAAKDALNRAKDTGAKIESTVEDKALEAKQVGKKGIGKLNSDAADVTTEAQGLLGSAFERGKEMVRSAVGMGPEQAVTGTSEATNAVEKALRQRFEKPDPRLDRAAADVLKERYMPMDQRDNTVLRGV